MAAVLRVIGWKAEGLRCPDHEISCLDPKDRPFGVTLVQMPNGTGKTTTLNLLRAALSGVWAQNPPLPIEVRKFQKKGGARTGLFEVQLLLNDHRVTLQLVFDFDSGRVRYRTTRGSGQVEGFDPPAEFRRFLNPNFVNFFVFDGELAQHLLDDKWTDAESVVETLFQLGVIKQLSAKVGEYWDRRAEKEAGDEKGKRFREGKLERARARLALLKRQKAALSRQREEAESQLKAQQKAYHDEIAKGEAAAQELDEAESNASDAKVKVRDQALDVLELMRDPHALSESFATAIHTLKINLDKAKLPGTAAREFFQDLSRLEECVCGRHIDDAVAEEIRKRAKNYLGSDEVGFLNAMKTDIDEAVGASRETPAECLHTQMDALEDLVRDEREAMNALDELRLQAERADPAVQGAKDEIDRLKGVLADLDEQLEKFDDKDASLPNDSTWGIDVMTKRVELAERKLAQATQTLELRRRRDVLKKILERAHHLAREGVIAEVCAEANARIADILPDNDIRIERIERCLVLDGQEGGSVGETLSVAYGFLATLFDRSEHQLPFVVDSPAGPIDLAVRPKIGDLVPKLSDQFIAFTISSERDRFTPRLKAASARPVQFLTVFRRGPADLEAQARKAGGVRESRDGMTVEGEAFFDAFQMDREEEYA